jgi:hypothetical protein
VEQDPPYYILLSTYISYLILIVLGHVRDFVGKRLSPASYKHLMPRGVSVQKSIFILGQTSSRIGGRWSGTWIVVSPKYLSSVSFPSLYFVPLILDLSFSFFRYLSFQSFKVKLTNSRLRVTPHLTQISIRSIPGGLKPEWINAFRSL